MHTRLTCPGSCPLSATAGLGNDPGPPHSIPLAFWDALAPRSRREGRGGSKVSAVFVKPPKGSPSSIKPWTPAHSQLCLGEHCCPAPTASGDTASRSGPHRGWLMAFSGPSQESLCTKGLV